ncbi:MAG: hypothetical protein J0H67_16965 [Rhodospirillales bacterium]|nr:hypothetical protein [Rhodospirillales bacterium]
MTGIPERTASPVHGFFTPSSPDDFDRSSDFFRSLGAPNHSNPLGVPQARPRTEARALVATRPGAPPSSWIGALALSMSLIALWAALCFS